MTGGGFSVGSIVGSLVLEKGEWNFSVKAVTKDMRDMGRDAKKLGEELFDIGKKTALAGAAIVAALGASVKVAADFGDEIYDMSKRTGIGTETLSAFKLLTEKSGTSLEGLAVGLRGLAGNMQEAAKGTGAQADLFKALGVSVVGSDGKLRSLNDVLFDASDRFSGMEDGAQKAAMAQDIFGRSGMELIPLLNQGAEGLREEMEAAEKFGLVVSGPAAAAADAFNDGLADLKASGEGFVMMIGNAIMPAAKTLISGLTGAVSIVKEWAEANPGLTKTLAEMGLALGGGASLVGTFSMGIGGAMKGLGGLAKSLGTTRFELVKTLGVYTALVGAIGFYVIKLGEAKAAIDDSAQAETNYNKANINLSNKLYELVKVGAMSVDTYYELWDRFNQNATAMAKFIKDGGAGVEVQKALVEIGKKHAAVIEEQREKTLGLGIEMDDLAGSFQTIEDRVTALDDDLRKLRMLGSFEVAAPVINTTGTLGDMIGGSLGKVTNYVESVEGLFDGLKTKVVGDSVDLADAAKTGLEQTAQFTNQIFGDFVTGFGSIMDGTRAMGEGFSSIINGMIGDMGRLVFSQLAGTMRIIVAEQMVSVAHFIASAFKTLGIFAIPVAAGAFAIVSGLFKKLLKFEEGGVFTEPTIAEIGHGTEYVLPERKLIDIVQNAMAGQGGGVAGSGGGASGPSGFGPHPTFAAAAASVSPTFQLHMSVHKLDRTTVMGARDLIFEAFEERVRTKGWGQLRSAVKHA